MSPFPDWMNWRRLSAPREYRPVYVPPEQRLWAIPEPLPPEPIRISQEREDQMGEDAFEGRRARCIGGHPRPMVRVIHADGHETLMCPKCGSWDWPPEDPRSHHR